MRCLERSHIPKPYYVNKDFMYKSELNKRIYTSWYQGISYHNLEQLHNTSLGRLFENPEETLK